MEQLVNKYAQKLIKSGLVTPDSFILGALDVTLTWSPCPTSKTREHSASAFGWEPLLPSLETIFSALNINSLLFARPTEPYNSIIEYLAEQNEHMIEPKDCETRTFLHDLPIVRSFDPEQIIEKLKNRKSVIIPGHGIITWGTVSPEQALVFFSSVCFACFVKFFSDHLVHSRTGNVSQKEQSVFDKAIVSLNPLPEHPPELMKGPFENEEQVYRAICEAGRKTVVYQLVDSSFGNISLLHNDNLYISQTTSWLDELGGCIDPCPMDGSTCAAITASSELSAHREMLQRTGMHTVLHTHPKFAVILSLDCEKENCEHEGLCHIKCTEKRFVNDIPIVPGEVGTGPTGLCNTVPSAIEDHRGAIVYGHGLFVLGQNDYNDAFKNLLAIERMCRDVYFSKL
ncbi:MAG: class II aldolase/adducin family protein [Kiritimatiellae bacterium]|nr:class II aldolase/adducin family protein [Kiritimatiellia bacterium]